MNVMVKINKPNLLFAVCDDFHTMFAAESTAPVVLLDTTMDGPQSSMVKKVTRQLKIPTLTTSYGHLGDIVEWKGLNSAEQEYLVQIMPPTDIIGQIVHDVGASQNLTTAGILYDDSFCEYFFYSLNIK